MDPSENKKPDIGCESWVGVDDYAENLIFYSRVVSFLKTTNWDELLRICSNQRGGMPCFISENYSLGVYNMVRQIIFYDGELWVARIRLPEMRRRHGDFPHVPYALSSEVASMKFLKSRTSIPVATVHHFDCSSDNSVGAPYILMDYIHGSIASDLRFSVNSEPLLFGTPEQDMGFRKQMASIQAELSSIVFDEIGCLQHDTTTGEFYIGAETRTGKGPWRSATDFYNDFADHHLNVAANTTDFDVVEDPSLVLPVVFKEVMQHYMNKSAGEGQFGLVHLDLGAHNILVNEIFEIVGLIDLDGLMTAPVEVQAQFPAEAGLDMEVPYHVSAKSLAMARIEATRPKLIEYKHLLQESEDRIWGERAGAVRPSQIIMSEAAIVFQGILDYMNHHLEENKLWMYAYFRLLRDRFVSEETIQRNRGYLLGHSRDA